MSAPKTRDPLTVTTRDGMSWVRRAVTQDGRGLYAPEGVCSCPEFVMATLVELAEHGIKGRDPVADAVAAMGALPVPVGPSLLSTRTCELVEMEADRNRWKADAAELRARVAELEAAQGDFLRPWIDRLDAKSLDNFLMDLSRATEYEPTDGVAAEIESTVEQWRTLIENRPADEDPIAYSLTVEALHASSGAVIETPSRREQSTAKLRGILAPGSCTECGDAPEAWCPGCAACRCADGHDAGCPNAPVVTP